MPIVPPGTVFPFSPKDLTFLKLPILLISDIFPSLRDLRSAREDSPCIRLPEGLPMPAGQ